jgi:hypothetical protein
MDPDDLTVDGEVVCQTVKEALLALKTVSADQLKSAVRPHPNLPHTHHPTLLPLLPLIHPFKRTLLSSLRAV